MPLVQQLHEKYQDDVVVLTVNIGGSPSGIAKFMTENNYSFLSVIDGPGAAKRDYKIQYVPTTFFVDKDGFIKDKAVGGWENLAQIEGRLKSILP